MQVWDHPLSFCRGCFSYAASVSDPLSHHPPTATFQPTSIHTSLYSLSTLRCRCSNYDYFAFSIFSLPPLPLFFLISVKKHITTAVFNYRQLVLLNRPRLPRQPGTLSFKNWWSFSINNLRLNVVSKPKW